jgi:NADPH2:quinone reductase
VKTQRVVLLHGKGGLDRLEVTDVPLHEPMAGELRVRVRASGAGSTDVMMRTGSYPFRPPFPFVPGYEVVGEVDAIGEGVVGFTQGDRVCALTVHGGWAEYLVRDAADFAKVPEGLDDAEVVALILNYVTAYQMIHRKAQMRAGQLALVTGANGGVGTAVLELLRATDVRVIGAASKRHFDLVRSLGGEPIESRVRPLDELVRALHPGGVDAAFDGLGGRIVSECIRATKRGGIVVGYGFMAATSGGKHSDLAVVRGFLALYGTAWLRGVRSTFYGITATYRKDKRPFHEDLPKLFELLAARRIQPKIAAKLPLFAGREAQRMLEEGGVAGKIVLLREVAP